jgi:predicted nucleic acid-binding Zn ribbon protein
MLMIWKKFKCKECGAVLDNKPVSPDTVELECECGGVMPVVLTPKFTKFKGGGWTTRKPVEAFPGESEYVEDWTDDTHGVAGSLDRDMDPDW